jgi:hypothetical protein
LDSGFVLTGLFLDQTHKHIILKNISIPGNIATICAQLKAALALMTLTSSSLANITM